MITNIGLSQADLKKFDFSKADSIALNLRCYETYTYVEITHDLTKNLDTELEKHRAIFRWITDSIDYSFRYRGSDPNLVIKKGIAVCAGYASLYKSMCDAADMQCIIVSGYTKTIPDDIQRKIKKTDHAWNRIKIDDQWYLIDVTWAAGYLKKRKFHKEFKECYFLADPQFFYKKHFPESGDFIGLEEPIKLKAFSKAPIYYEASHYLKDISEKKGILKYKAGKKYSIEIETTVDNPHFSASIGSQKEGFYSEISSEGNKHTITFVVHEARKNDELTIYLNSYAMVKYKLILR